MKLWSSPSKDVSDIKISLLVCAIGAVIGITSVGYPAYENINPSGIGIWTYVTAVGIIVFTTGLAMIGLVFKRTFWRNWRG